jgi:peptidoglycan/xylan/chitin deacetylase (PgdA/CDA1 family)
MASFRERGARVMAAAGGTVSTVVGGAANRRGAVVLAYHDITRLRTTDYQVTPHLLRRHVEWLRRANFEIVSLLEIRDRLNVGRSVDGLAAVTFDDALVGVHREALPILVDLEVPATLFPVTDRIGRRAEWWPGSDRVMTAAQLRETVELGIEIGAHTRTHVSLPGLSDSELRREVQGSRKALQDLLGVPVEFFAYPFGHVDRAALEAVAAAGYTAACTFQNGRVLQGADPFLLPRLTMWRGHNRLRFAYHLSRDAASWPALGAPARAEGASELTGRGVQEEP